jgi:hypothetical protein
MKYTVVWKPSVRDRLAETWIDAPDRRAVSDAAHRIDQLLQEDPADRGESRDEGTRILVELPLAVVYEIVEDDRLVQVLAIRHVPTRPVG